VPAVVEALANVLFEGANGSVEVFDADEDENASNPALILAAGREKGSEEFVEAEKGSDETETEGETEEEGEGVEKKGSDIELETEREAVVGAGLGFRAKGSLAMEEEEEEEEEAKGSVLGPETEAAREPEEAPGGGRRPDPGGGASNPPVAPFLSLSRLDCDVPVILILIFSPCFILKSFIGIDDVTSPI